MRSPLAAFQADQGPESEPGNCYLAVPALDACFRAVQGEERGPIHPRQTQCGCIERQSNVLDRRHIIEAGIVVVVQHVDHRRPGACSAQHTHRLGCIHFRRGRHTLERIVRRFEATLAGHRSRQPLAIIRQQVAGVDGDQSATGLDQGCSKVEPGG